jgi:SAM-dependent methyltransferase
MNPVPNFNRLAQIYRWLEYLSFGPFLWRCRIRFLPDLAHCRRALVLGDGDGRFTARLLQTNRGIVVHAVDGSPRMMKSLDRACIANSSRLTMQVVDIRTWQPMASAQYDLVVTHFFLDCLTSTEIAALAARIAPSVTPGALWLVSEFAVPSTRFGRLVAGPLVTALYHAFGLLTNLRVRSLPNYEQALRCAGCCPIYEERSLNGLLVSQLWRLVPCK